MLVLLFIYLLLLVLLSIYLLLLLLLLLKGFWRGQSCSVGRVERADAGVRVPTKGKVSGVVILKSQKSY
jgi:hypothetical protein